MPDARRPADDMQMTRVCDHEQRMEASDADALSGVKQLRLRHTEQVGAVVYVSRIWKNMRGDKIQGVQRGLARYKELQRGLPIGSGDLVTVDIKSASRGREGRWRRGLR